MNKVILMGRLGRDVDMSYSASGMAIAKINLATNSISKGEKKTEWHNIVAFGKTAENCSRYLDKGSQALVEGMLSTSSWEDKETGKKRYRTEILASNVQFIFTGDKKEEEPVMDNDVKPEAQKEFTTDDIPF